MVSCAVCKKSLEGTRYKDLKGTLIGNDGSKTFLDLVAQLAHPTSAKSRSAKLVSHQACLPCFRELSSYSELQSALQSKQAQLARKISGTKSSSAERNRPATMTTGTLKITREAVPKPPDSISLAMRSIVGMDAEITITEEENGGAAIDVEVVEGTSDLKRPNGLFGCRFCKKEFIRADCALNHMQEAHGRILHRCEICAQEFRLKSEMDRHRADHLTGDPYPYQCGNCPRAFQSFEAFQEHSKEHALKRRFGCGQCGRKYDAEDKLAQHMATHQLRPFACPRCGKTFRSQFAYVKHQRQHTATETSPATGSLGAPRFHCNLCPKNFSSAEGLHGHLKNHNKPFKYVFFSSFFFKFLKISKVSF